MNKDNLVNFFNQIDINNYVWDLYFFKLSKKTTNPFIIEKKRFRDNTSFNEYCKSLIELVTFYQINSIEDVQKYNGENTKISCDMLELNDNIIKEQWELFSDALINSSEEPVIGKVTGYVICGNHKTDITKSLVLVRMACPSLNFNKKHNIVFSTNIEKELDLYQDELYRLYLNIDYFIINKKLYTFNHNFEKMFDLESTLKKHKVEAIDKIAGRRIIANIDEFKRLAFQYKSSRTFLTLSEDKLNLLGDPHQRERIAIDFEIGLDNEKNFFITNETETKNLLKYVCMKLVQDKDTDDILEVSSATKHKITDF